MKIAIPLDENKQDVCIVLARAPYFMIREDGKDSIVENPAAQAQGGAGKTLVAVNLAAVAKNATYIDCDVEEPDGRLFLKPVVTETKIVTTLLPEFDPDKCIGCKKCVQFCRFHALIYIKKGQPYRVCRDLS